MQEACETFEQDGYKAEVFQDYDPESPKGWSTLGTFVTLASLSAHYPFGHRESDYTEDDAVERGGAALLARYLRMTMPKGAEIVFLRFEDYGSSGARLCETDESDNRVNAFLYVDGEDIAREFGAGPDARNKARACLETELEAWSQYVEGDIYGYVVTRPNGTDAQDGSLWGLYGFEYAREEAQSALKNAIRYDREDAHALGYARATAILNRGA